MLNVDFVQLFNVFERNLKLNIERNWTDSWNRTLKINVWFLGRVSYLLRLTHPLLHYCITNISSYLIADANWSISVSVDVKVLKWVEGSGNIQTRRVSEIQTKKLNSLICETINQPTLQLFSVHGWMCLCYVMYWSEQNWKCMKSQWKYRHLTEYWKELKCQVLRDNRKGNYYSMIHTHKHTYMHTFMSKYAYKLRFQIMCKIIKNLNGSVSSTFQTKAWCLMLNLNEVCGKTKTKYAESAEVPTSAHWFTL